jgi:CIC family chloride channel protein
MELARGGNGGGNGGSLRLLVAAVLVGAIAGLLGVGFRELVDRLQSLATGSGANMLEAARALPWWHRLLLPAGGALLGALLLHWLGRGETAFGTRDLMEVVTLRKRSIKLGPTLGRVASALATIASGGSVGREGPIMQLGATAAALVGRAARPGPRAFSILLAAGAAAGMASAYNAPLAGAVFAMEIVLSNFAIDVFVPVAFASVAGFLVKRALLGPDPVYDVAPDRVTLTWTLVLCAVPLGIACAPLGIAFQRLLQRATAAFERLPVHPIARTVVGGALVGVIGLWLPEVWGNGYQAVNELSHRQLVWWMAAVLLVMKPVATACSIGSGGQGGIFTPSMMTGAALGSLLASALRGAGHTGLPAEGFVFVGMAGVLATITHAPITVALLLFELTDRSSLVVPLALCSGAAAVTARLLARDSFYTESLRKRGVPVDAGIEELTLHQTKVAELARATLPTVRADAPLAHLLKRFSDERLDLLFVVDGDERLLGVVTLHAVKEYFNRSGEGAARVVIASEVMRRTPMLHPDQSLAEVLESFDEPDLDELPVVTRSLGGADGGRLIGRIERRDVIALLNDVVLGRAHLRAKLAIEGSEHPRYLELPRGFELARIAVTAALAGRRLGDTGLRRNHRLVVLAIVRPDPEIGEQRIAFDPDLLLEEGEQVLVMGRKEDIAAARHESQQPVAGAAERERGAR